MNCELCKRNTYDRYEKHLLEHSLNYFDRIRSLEIKLEKTKTEQLRCHEYIKKHLEAEEGRLRILRSAALRSVREWKQPRNFPEVVDAGLRPSSSGKKSPATTANGQTSGPRSTTAPSAEENEPDSSAPEPRDKNSPKSPA